MMIVQKGLVQEQDEVEKAWALFSWESECERAQYVAAAVLSWRPTSHTGHALPNLTATEGGLRWGRTGSVWFSSATRPELAQHLSPPPLPVWTCVRVRVREWEGVCVCVRERVCVCVLSHVGLVVMSYWVQFFFFVAAQTAFPILFTSHWRLSRSATSAIPSEACHNLQYRRLLVLWLWAGLIPDLGQICSREFYHLGVK